MKYQKLNLFAIKLWNWTKNKKISRFWLVSSQKVLRQRRHLEPAAELARVGRSWSCLSPLTGKCVSGLCFWSCARSHASLSFSFSLNCYYLSFTLSSPLALLVRCKSNSSLRIALHLISFESRVAWPAQTEGWGFSWTVGQWDSGTVRLLHCGTGYMSL